MNNDIKFENLSPEEQRKSIEIEKYHDVAEKIVLEYICYYYKKTPDQLFLNSDIINYGSEPLIITPLEEYSDKYLSLFLEVVPYDFKTNLPNELKENPVITNSIGFLYHSIMHVYSAILNCNIQKDIALDIFNGSFHFELNDENLTFYPVFIYPKRREQLMFLQFKDDLEKTLAKFPDDSVETNSSVKETVEKLKVQYNNVINFLESLDYNEEEANEIELKKNEEIFKYNRVGIKFEELHFEQLPEKYKTYLCEGRHKT